MKQIKFLGAVLLASALSYSLIAQAQSEDKTKEIVEFKTSPQQIQIKFKPGVKNVNMTVKGPDGFYVNDFLGDDSNDINIKSLQGMADGFYHYEFSASSDVAPDKVKKSFKDDLNNGRNNKKNKSAVEPVNQSGYFRMKDGAVVMNDVEENDSTGENQ